MPVRTRISRALRWAALPAGLLLVAGLAVADAPSKGDIRHGKAITKGAPEVKPEQACSSCHGDTGEGNAGSGIPRLAGQSEDYLLGSLDDYASGARKSEAMTPIAKALKEDQRRDVAAYYASLTTSDWKKPEAAQANQLRHGQTLATVGSAALGVQGCMNCHGPQGRGLPPNVPYLAGQSADYITDRLKDWRKAPLSDDAEGSAIMAQIARHLSDNDIKSVAAYFAQLPPDPLRLGDASKEAKQ